MRKPDLFRQVLRQFVISFDGTRLNFATILLYLLFLAGQVFRARIGVRKSELAFADYASSRDRTGMFMPRIGRIKGGDADLFKPLLKRNQNNNI